MPATICALSSPADPAARAIVRLSGPDCAAILGRCVQVDGRALELGARGVVSGRFDDGRGAQPVDVWWMPGPASYTREDTAELHLAGSPFLVDAVLARLLELGCEPAGPGEFTRRAFEHGRLDLTQAEGVLELVNAQSEDERRAALLLFEGGLSERIDALRERLAELRALCEASLDFDEADTGHVPSEELARRTDDALAALAEATRWEDRRAPTPSSPRVALCGPPNAGKSTLFNALTRSRALVHDAAGTTRDQLRAIWRIGGAGGLDLELIDAPGIEAARDDVEARALALARRTRGAVELVLVVVSGVDGDGAPNAPLRDELAALPDVPRLLVWAQVDRPEAPPEPPAALVRAVGAREVVALSAVVREGLDRLERAAGRALGLAGADAGRPAPTQVAPAIARRHRRALARAREELERAAAGLTGGAPLDLVAEALRAATDELDAISGRTAPEDLLDRIFARFCIGK